MVPEDHLVRGLKEITERVAGKALRELYEDHGGIAYDPVSLLCVLLYGFMLGVRGSRQLEELCRYDVRLMYLAGSLKPDHNTLSRYRLRIDSRPGRWGIS